MSPRVRRGEDRAGDPLDGLVNLFDLGIVLSVGFLLAALSSLDLAGQLTDGEATPSRSTLTVPSDAATGAVPTDGETAIGEGAAVGTVYRLADGQLIYVVDPSAAPPDPGPEPGPARRTVADPMSFFLDGLQRAWELILGLDPFLVQLVVVTGKVVAVSTVVSLVIGLPVALILGLGRFRGRGALVVLANTGLALPPVVVGLVLALLMFPEAPLGRFGWLFTLTGVYIAQSCLCLPIMVALTVSAVRDLPPGLFDQARAFGAGRVAVARLATREARIGVLAAVIASVDSGLSEVGAIVLVGGNIRGYDQTLASAALEAVGAGSYAEAMAIGIILLGLIVVVTAVLTGLQYGGHPHPLRWRVPRRTQSVEPAS